MDFEIIKAAPEMADEIGYIHAISWQQAYQSIIPEDFLQKITPEKRAALFRKLVQINGIEYYLFRVDQKGAGMAALCRADDENLGENVGEISALYFLSDHWGTGCAHKAMRFCLERLEQLGYRSAILWVLEENGRARRFYEKFGFTPNGRKKEVDIGKPLIEIFYEKSLSTPKEA